MFGNLRPTTYLSASYSLICGLLRTSPGPVSRGISPPLPNTWYTSDRGEQFLLENNKIVAHQVWFFSANISRGEKLTHDEHLVDLRRRFGEVVQNPGEGGERPRGNDRDGRIGGQQSLCQQQLA